MRENEKSEKDRQEEKEAEYNQQIAQARIERALARYERLLLNPLSDLDTEPTLPP